MQVLFVVKPVYNDPLVLPSDPSVGEPELFDSFKERIEPSEVKQC